MCGILSILNFKNIDINASIKNAITLGNNRGPEMTKVLIKNEVQFVFHRLSINGLNDESMQPIELLDCVLICNNREAVVEVLDSKVANGDWLSGNEKIEIMRAQKPSISRKYSLDDSVLVKARADLRDLIAS